ncbi:MAG: 4-hydroxythreonine-4-phosphate dehydrogenase, partial [Devosiaceae bacterium]|nr:4-hydroxythreonine-4-phosphate dehydrogenase [Devosiaceae bacterium]
MTPLAISIGEAAGIGPDLILQIYSRRSETGLPAFVVYGNLEFLRARAKRLGLPIKIEASSPAKSPELFSHALPVLDIGEGVP